MGNPWTWTQKLIRERERILRRVNLYWDRAVLFTHKWGETAAYIAVVILLAILLWGCASAAPCPEPDVIADPTVVEVMVPETGEPLQVCVAPAAEVCDQAEILDRVRCVGRNHQRLEICHQQNVDTIESHNQAVTDD